MIPKLFSCYPGILNYPEWRHGPSGTIATVPPRSPDGLFVVAAAAKHGSDHCHRQPTELTPALGSFFLLHRSAAPHFNQIEAEKQADVPRDRAV